MSFGITLCCNISAIGGGVSYPEEAKGPAQGRPFRQIKALSGTATGEMDFQRGRRSYRARDEGRETSDVYSSVCRRRTVTSVDERERVELDERQSTELKKTRAMFPREIGMLIELGMITVLSPPNNVREPEPRAELPTSVVDDHNWDGVGRQTVKSTIDWEGFQCL